MIGNQASGGHAESSEARQIRHVNAQLAEVAGHHPSERARTEAQRQVQLWEQLAEVFDQVAACEAEAHEFDDGSRYTPIVYGRKPQ